MLRFYREGLIRFLFGSNFVSFISGDSVLATPFLMWSISSFLGIPVTGSEKLVKMISLCSLREGQVLGEMPQAFRGERFSYASHSL